MTIEEARKYYDFITNEKFVVNDKMLSVLDFAKQLKRETMVICRLLREKGNLQAVYDHLREKSKPLSYKDFNGTPQEFLDKYDINMNSATLHGYLKIKDNVESTEE